VQCLSDDRQEYHEHVKTLHWLLCSFASGPQAFSHAYASDVYVTCNTHQLSISVSVFSVFEKTSVQKSTSRRWKFFERKWSILQLPILEIPVGTIKPVKIFIVFLVCALSYQSSSVNGRTFSLTRYCLRFSTSPVSHSHESLSISSSTFICQFTEIVPLPTIFRFTGFWPEVGLARGSFRDIVAVVRIVGCTAPPGACRARLASDSKRVRHGKQLPSTFKSDPIPQTIPINLSSSNSFRCALRTIMGIYSL